MEPIKIIPLGGLGEFGLNMMLIEYGDAAIAIDCGLMFPGADLLGIAVVRIEFDALEAAWERAAERVLVAAGRKPNSRDLGLDKAGVAVDDKGFIKTGTAVADDRRRPVSWRPGPDRTSHGRDDGPIPAPNGSCRCSTARDAAR